MSQSGNMLTNARRCDLRAGDEFTAANGSSPQRVLAVSNSHEDGWLLLRHTDDNVELRQYGQKAWHQILFSVDRPVKQPPQHVAAMVDLRKFVDEMPWATTNKFVARKRILDFIDNGPRVNYISTASMILEKTLHDNPFQDYEAVFYKQQEALRDAGLLR